MKVAHLKPFALTAALLLGSGLARAQDEMPAVSSPAADKPIVARPASPTPNVDAAAAAGGTTIFGERESPIGLYITPWRDAHAERDIDRPARLLQEKAMPIDRTVFNRQVEYYEALAAELKKKGVVSPVAP
ncbi:hypothetical protein [Solimonas soli]|uniref:hypothetical protein n=1 Tax=Solimonas soli TaxID=413479 RepID=UPI000483BB72|nr:hypothetical protein [Solimonas soli]